MPFNVLYIYMYINLFNSHKKFVVIIIYILLMKTLRHKEFW